MSRTGTLAGLAAALACGCVLPPRGEVKADNCVNAVASFDQQYCTNIIPMHDRYQEVEGRHYQLAGMCDDPASKSRLDELAATCVESYRFAANERDADEEQLRARYARQVKALKADPAYTVALDAWRAAHDEAEVAERDYEEHGRPIRSAYERRAERSVAKLRDAEDQLREVISRHGIDPAHASVLGVW